MTSPPLSGTRGRRRAAAPPLLAALLALLAGCDPAVPTTPALTLAAYEGAGGTAVGVEAGELVAVAPPGGTLLIRADAPAGDFAIRPPALRPGAALEATLESEGPDGPRVVWRSVRPHHGEGAYPITLQTERMRVRSVGVEAVGPDGGATQAALDPDACRTGCDGGATQVQPSSWHYTRVCDDSGCVVIVTYDFVGGETGSAQAVNTTRGGSATLWTPPGGGEAVRAQEVRFRIEGAAELAGLRWLRIGGFERLAVLADQFRRWEAEASALLR